MLGVGGFGGVGVLVVLGCWVFGVDAGVMRLVLTCGQAPGRSSAI